MPRRLLSVAALLLAARCAPVPSTTDAFGYRRPPPGREAGTSFAALDRALVRALERGQPASLDAPPPPLALTTSDGAGLALTALHVEAVVVGPLALTQLHLTFHNPEPRVREGRFTIALPPGAAVSRFAMKNEAWLEAEVVPRQEARRVYETYLHRQTDPALLEQDAGNGFSARVFPIAASGDKELIIAYGHALTDAASRRVALAGLPAVDDLTWDITAAGHTDHGHAARTAPADLVLPATDAGPVAIAAGGAFVARVPLPAATARDPLDAVTLLIDTSASRAALIGRQAALVRTLLAELAASAPAAAVRIIAFDQTAELLLDGRADALVDAVGPALIARGGLGASDLGAALAAAADADRVIMIGDGIATAGPRAAAQLVAAVRASAIGRLDALTVGDQRDLGLLTALAAAGARPGTVGDGEAADARVGLDRAVVGDLPVAIDGVDQVWPPRVASGAPGATVVIAGRRTGADDAPLRIAIGAAPPIEVMPNAAPAPLVDRAVARIEIAALEQRAAAASRSEAERAADRATIERLGLAHRLVTAATSLLVLETDEDYARFCLRRDALADIVTVAHGDVAVLDRSPGHAPAAPCAAAAAPPTPTPDAAPATSAGATGADATDVVDGITTPVGEVIVIVGHAPSIDVGSTHTGVTITEEYTRNIPTGRTFGAVLGTAGGDGPELDALGNLLQPRDAHPIPTVFPTPAPPPPPPPPPPYDGRLLTVMTDVAAGRNQPALANALAWYVAEPGELAAIVALGEALEARGAVGLAARAYGSLLDRFGGRAELARYAGERLDRLGPAGRALAIDAYRQAVADRPDQLGGHRLLAVALARAGDTAGAIDTLVAAVPRATVASIAAILRADLGDVAAVAIARDPDQRAALTARLARVGARVAAAPSVRVVLQWETDTNDVDLHVHDHRGGHAYYQDRALPSGGALLDDITSGYGPEQFAIPGRGDAGPYRIAVHYYARGPMGLGLGTVQVLRHDGAGHLTVDDRPFVLSRDDAMLDVGEF